MNQSLLLKDYLQTLNDLLTRERNAITHLRMEKLNTIQQEKSRLLAQLQYVTVPVDQEHNSLIQKIKINNEHNQLLLQSGLKLISKLKENVRRRLTLTYAARGSSLTIGVGPRIFNRSV